MIGGPAEVKCTLTKYVAKNSVLVFYSAKENSIHAHKYKTHKLRVYITRTGRDVVAEDRRSMDDLMSVVKRHVTSDHVIK